MSELIILRPEERRTFDKCPALSKHERQIYFRLDAKTKREISKLPKQINRLGFVLQLGYFKAIAKFYPTSAFKKRDINYVKRLLGMKESMAIDFSAYTSSTYYRHQEKIEKLQKWTPFNDSNYIQLLAHAQHHAGLQRKPAYIFRQLITFCWKHQITIPTYTELAEIITEGFLVFEKNTLSDLKQHIDPLATEQLDHLLKYRGQQRHPITTLKGINQSVRPRDLAESVAITENVGKYFFKFEPVISQLSLSDQAIEYYATWVQKARTKQLTDISDPHKAYLHLLAYFKHQYYSRQDALMAAFIKCVNSSLNAAKNRLTKHEANTRNTRNQAIRGLAKNNKSHRQLLEDIRLVSKLS